MENQLERILNFKGQEIKVKTDKGVELFNLANSCKVLNIIKEKDFKITQLETALNQSLISLNSGMENVKIANQLDSEIKQFISKV